MQGSTRPPATRPPSGALPGVDDGGVVHTHSTWATVWAQAGFSILSGNYPCRRFSWSVPCTRYLSRMKYGEYEAETGHVIVET